MSVTKVGKIAPFPPLPGQPYPPARNHPRWKELYRLHDEWLMKYWPFSSEKKRARVPFMNLAGFSTWSAPAADFDRMVWGGRIAGIFFLADDYVDTAKMHDRIPGFKAAATGTGPLHLEDRAELCHDIVFRAIKADSHPRTFEQLTICTHEWWDSNIHEPFRNLDQYLATRRVNIAMYFANSYFRWTLDINLTHEQVNHPLMREAEGIVSDHVGLTNDLFSYVKETMTNSDDTNVLRMLQDHEGLSYEQAKDAVIKKIRQKEQDYIPAGLAVLNDPELGKDPEVRRWIACLPYCMGGNMAWSQESGRYNVGDISGGVPFPSLSVATEATPADEVVDDTEESLIRDRIFGVKDIPPPDFALDSDPIEAGKIRTVTESAIPAHVSLPAVVRPRPEDVGILAMDVYLPRRCISSRELKASRSVHPGKQSLDLGQEYISYVDDCEDINSIALSTVSSLIKKYNVDPQQIGYIAVCTETIIDRSNAPSAVLTEFFKERGNQDIEVIDFKNGSNGSAPALFNAINWIESNSWDGRNAIIFAGDVSTNTGGAGQPGGVGATALLVGPNAPLVVESSRGTFIDNVVDGSWTTTTYLTALEETCVTYKRRRAREISDLYARASKRGDERDTHVEDHKVTNSVNGITNGVNGTHGVNGINGHHGINGDSDTGSSPVVSMLEFDYMIYHAPHAELAHQAHSRLHYNEYLANPGASAYANIRSHTKSNGLKNSDLEDRLSNLALADYKTRVSPSLAVSRCCGNLYTGSVFGGLASLLDAVPSYEIFEHRISMFEFGSRSASSFFVIRVKGDTKPIRDVMNLKERLGAIQVTPSEEYIRAMKLREVTHNAMPYRPAGSLDGLLPETYYLESITPQGLRKYGLRNERAPNGRGIH